MTCCLRFPRFLDLWFTCNDFAVKKNTFIPNIPPKFAVYLLEGDAWRLYTRGIKRDSPGFLPCDWSTHRSVSRGTIIRDIFSTSACTPVFHRSASPTPSSTTLHPVTTATRHVWLRTLLTPECTLVHAPCIKIGRRYPHLVSDNHHLRPFKVSLNRL